MEHLGYVQIDTINVIERCHHQILYTRIPGYRREHLRQAQSIDKTVFEYWTHALSYVPTRDFRYYLGAMRREWRTRSGSFSSVKDKDLRRVLSLVKRKGALTIRDIDEDAVDKDHLWASRKPSKRALELAFYQGKLTVSQRRRLHLFFDYEHRFEAYLPAAKRKFGYFSQPVLVDGDIAVVIDLKTDRERQKLLLQRWTWVSKRSRRLRKEQIEEALHRFERFQLAR